MFNKDHFLNRFGIGRRSAEITCLLCGLEVAEPGKETNATCRCWPPKIEHPEEKLYDKIYYKHQPSPETQTHTPAALEGENTP